jgi:hypothetical protein
MGAQAQTQSPDQWGPELFRSMSFRIEELELLRCALSHLKEKHKVSWAEIERQADISIRRVERFVTQHRRPIDHHDLQKMADWVASMLGSQGSPLTRALKSVVTITYNEVRRVWKAYAGDWICVSEAESPGHFYCAELNICLAPSNHNAEDFPLPKFILRLGSDEVVDGGEEPIPHHLEGYIQLRDEELYFVGQSLWEPRGRLGFLVFADNPERDRREFMSGWGLLLTLDRSSPKPRRFAASRLPPARIGSVSVGRLSEAECVSGLPNFSGLLQRLRTG